ncbi:MAG: YfhO family protein [Eubacterium sp.]|nr:YfhO family protein [Eubacterium sp.]
MRTIIRKKYIPLYALAFIIPLLSVFIGFFSGSYAPFGSKNVLTASGYSDYLPYYYEFYDRIHDGMGLGYSTHSGLGYDFTSLVAYFISDPLNMLILLFPRNCIISVLNILYMIKLGFAGSFMSMFFVYKKNAYKLNFSDTDNSKDAQSKKDSKKNFVIGVKSIPNSSILRFIMTFNWDILAFSVAYALSLSMIGVGMNIAFTGAIAVFPLVMLGFEMLFREGKTSFLIVALTLSVFSNLHISIISIIFLICYIATRDYNDMNHFIKSLIKTFYSILISAICASVIIICSIQGGFFTSNNSLYFPNVTFDNYMNTVRQLMSQGIVSYISMYGTNDIAVSILTLLLVLCYIIQSKIKIFSKIKNIFLMLFILSGTFVSTTRYLFNGFNLNARNSIHFAYIICFMFLLIAFEELQYIKNIKPLTVLISFILASGIAIGALFFADNYDNSSIYIKTLEYLFGYFLIIMIYSSKSMTKTLFRTIISVLLLVEIVLPNITNTTNIGNFYLSQKLDNVHSLQLYEATRELHKKVPNAKVLIYNPESSFETPLTTSLSGYDYIVSSSKAGSFGYFTHIDTIQKEKNIITVYEYKIDKPITNSYYPSDIKNFKYNLQNPFESSNQLSTIYLNGKNIFELLDISVEPAMDPKGTSVSFNISLNNELKSGYVFFNAYSARYLFDAAEINSGNAIQNTPKSNNLNIKYAYTGAKLNKKNIEELLSNVVSNIIISKKNNSFFDINSTSEGYVSTCFKNIPSLNFYVNNKRVKPISIINDNALVPVIQGDNHIEVIYSYNGLIIGIILLLLGIAILVLNSKCLKEHTKRIYQTSNNLVNSIVAFCSNNLVYIASISVVLLVFILCLMITSSAPFGVYSAIRDDGIAQYFPIYINTINSIKNNGLDTLTSFSTCGFQDILRHIIDFVFTSNYCISYFNISSPNILLFLYTVYNIFFLLLPPITLIYYLTHRHYRIYNKSDKRLIIYSVLYSLSSYTAVFFQFYVGFRINALLPLIMLGMDQLINKKKNALYICILSYFMIINPYSCFLVCEFLLLYFFTMNFNNLKDFISKGFRFAKSSILAAFISAFSLIPFYYSTRLSPYLGTDNKSASILKFYTSYIRQIAEYHTCNAIKTVTDNDSQTASFCGLIMLFVLPLYMLNKEINVKIKLKRVLLILFFFLATNNELLNYILHGFHFQTLVPNRFAIFIIFLLVITLADIRLSKKTYDKKKYLYSILLTSLAIFAIYLHTYTEPSITINITFLMLGLYVITAIFNANRSQHYLLYIAIIDIIINSIIVFPVNIGSKSDLIYTANDFNVISESNPDTKEFYNLTEYISNNSGYKNIGKLTSLNSLSFFDSTITQGNMDYISYYNIETGSNNIIYKSNPMADMMLRIKYHITNDYNKDFNSDYPVVDQINEYKLHENPNYISLGFITKNNNRLNTIKNEDFNNSFEYQNNLSLELGGTEIYDIIDCYSISDIEQKDDTVYYVREDSYIQKDKHSDTTIMMPTTLYFPTTYTGKVYLNKGNVIYKIGELSADNHQISFEDYYYTYNNDNHPIIAILKEQNLSNLRSILSMNKLTDIKRNKDSITATINNTYDGTLFISLPYYEGWNIYVDGTKTDYKQYLGGVGLEISKGTHHIEMRYHSPNLNIGIAISCITILLMLINYIFKENRTKKAQSDEL